MKILIVDDNSSFLETATLFLELNTDYKIEGVKNGAEAISEVSKIHPDVILLDYNLPDMSGVEVAVEIANISEKAKIVMVTSYEEYQIPNLSSINSIKGFIPKSRFSENILSVIDNITAPLIN